MEFFEIFIIFVQFLECNQFVDSNFYTIHRIEKFYEYITLLTKTEMGISFKIKIKSASKLLKMYLNNIYTNTFTYKDQKIQSIFV